MIDEKLLAILACPVCKAPLRLEGESLVCTKTEARFPIEDGIPNLLPDSAKPPHPDRRSDQRSEVRGQKAEGKGQERRS